MNLDFLVTRVIDEGSGFDTKMLKQSLQVERESNFGGHTRHLGLKTAI